MGVQIIAGHAGSTGETREKPDTVIAETPGLTTARYAIWQLTMLFIHTAPTTLIAVPGATLSRLVQYSSTRGRGREVWKLSPDTKGIRQHLLELLAAMKEEPGDEYPIGGYLDEIVVWQLGEFREQRAILDLKRVAAFSPLAATARFGRNRKSLTVAAKSALGKIG